MAARLNARHSDMVRDKIRASQIVNRLEDHVFGSVDLSPSQVTAALGLLRKCVPDISESKNEHSGPDGEPINIAVNWTKPNA